MRVYIYRGEHSLCIHTSIYVYTIIKKTDPILSRTKLGGK
jgi:hypothetical protein